MSALATILCPVDSSEFSRRAVRYAAALGRTFGSRLVVLSVRPAAPPPELWLTRSPLVAEETAAERAAVVEAIRRFVAPELGDLAVEVQLRDGEVVTEILRTADEIGADLIAMGTHGLRGFTRLLLGSVTERVLQQARCAILTVRESAGPGAAFQTVVCGMDGSDASKRALAFASDLARRTHGRVVVVHAIEDFAREGPAFHRHFNIEACWRAASPEIQEAYAALAPEDLRAAGRIEVKVPLGPAYRAIMQAAAEASADLIVIGTSGATTPFGTTALRVVREATPPVLAVPPLALES
jgi:nucleotide-binding universal stress UspA family protein